MLLFYVGIYIYKIIVLCEVFVNVWLLNVSIYPLRGDICYRKATLDLILSIVMFFYGEDGFCERNRYFW